MKPAFLIFIILAVVVSCSPKAPKPPKRVAVKRQFPLIPLPPPLPTRANRIGKLDLTPKTYYLVWSNTSWAHEQIVETAVNGVWIQYALLPPAHSNETWLKLDTTNPVGLFRVGYKWP